MRTSPLPALVTMDLRIPFALRQVMRQHAHPVPTENPDQLSKSPARSRDVIPLAVLCKDLIR
jgi:hypothetical protein